ncbi:MAG: hypothetical protein ACRECX_08740 [Methyloceanibacter sp.]|uniref:hypothetical protein n=1 Tax=Methyloceanibacter sp. TaxID=1965321 RepID=UPI003D6D7CDE
MPKRGSVQFLLLSPRPRTMLGWGAGAAAVLLLAGTVHLKDEWTETGIAHALRQSAWEQALAGQSGPERWPWEDLSVNMSLAPAANVPRLGLSAAITKHADTPRSTAWHRATNAKAAQEADGLGDVAVGDVALGDVVLGDAPVGDSITFTAADGATCVYTFTRRHVVDPHLAASEAGLSDAAASLFKCGPIERVEAPQRELPAAAQTGDQHKL